MLLDAEDYVKLIEGIYPETKIGLVGYSLGGGMSLSLILRNPGRFATFVGIAPYLAYATPRGTLSVEGNAVDIAKFYPEVVLTPPLKSFAAHLKIYYDDPYQVTRGVSAGSYVVLKDI